MPDLSRPTSKPAPNSGEKQKVILLRQPVKSVRASDMPDRAPVRLAFVALTVAGSVGLIWLMGHLGYRLGYAPAVWVPELLAEPGEGLATGANLLISTPALIFSAGLDAWLALMVWFVVIALPASAIAAVRRRAPGGPPPSRGEAALTMLGSLLAIVAALGISAWTLSSWRRESLGPLPGLLADVSGWSSDVNVTAGLDAMSLLAALLWLTLATRFSLARWLRMLCIIPLSFAVAATGLSLAISAGIASQASAPRSLVHLPDGESADPYLLLGYTREHCAVVGVVDQTIRVWLVDRPAEMAVLERISLVEWLEQTYDRRRDR